MRVARVRFQDSARPFGIPAFTDFLVFARDAYALTDQKGYRCDPADEEGKKYDENQTVGAGKKAAGENEFHVSVPHRFPFADDRSEPTDQEEKCRADDTAEHTIQDQFPEGRSVRKPQVPVYVIGNESDDGQKTRKNDHLVRYDPVLIVGHHNNR